MRKDITEALTESGCSADAVTTALQIVAQVYRVPASSLRPWLAGTRHDGSCVVAVDARRETVLIECDAFGAAVIGTMAWPLTRWTDEQRERLLEVAYARR